MSVERIAEGYGDEEVLKSFYLEFWRRALVLELMRKYCPKGGTVIDLDAQSFIISCALKIMGYEVIAYDYNPERYLGIGKTCSVEVIRYDLERDSLNLENDSVGCAVFSEVIKHINPYYI